ncbi:MAG: hypothetical protein USCAAHI_01320 [Beijerinckiaceae bacterium]|nr:MAG: hypothetical protein USCAAHI_01320 [Beijerinckiaceae bacterium]
MSVGKRARRARLRTLAMTVGLLTIDLLPGDRLATAGRNALVFIPKGTVHAFP